MRPTATDGTEAKEAGQGSRLRRISHGLAAFACCYSVLIFLGWRFNIQSLVRIVTTSAPIHPHTAATFVALSIAMVLSPWIDRWKQRLAMFCAVLGIIVGSLRILATLSGRSFWIGDSSIVQDAAVMAMSTAIVLVCLGCACLCMMAAKGRNWIVATLLALLATAFGAVAAFGYTFGASMLYTVTGQVMALPTAILTLLVAFSVIASRPPTGITAHAIGRIGTFWLNLPIRNKCLAVVALPVACLIFEIGWQIRILKALDEAQQWTTHTQQVELTVAELQQLLLRIESNDRGYGLSGSNEFLTPLSQDEADAMDVAQRLTRMVEDNPTQLVRARNLEELSRAKLQVARDVTAFFVAHPASARSASTPEFRLRLLESKARMDEFTTLSRIFAEEEQRLLTERMVQLKIQQQLSQRVLVLTIVTGLGAGLFAALLFSWSVANRLTRLTYDSRRIARGEIIPAPPPGEDEVSSLSWALHSASHRINEQMQGLEALNRDLESFSYSVSHDLRSPLRHIHGFSKILRADFSAELPAEAQRYLSRIESGAERMGQLIDDLLNFSRIGRRDIDRQPVPLRSLVDNLVEELNDGSGGRLIDWQIEPLPTVQGDPALIKQVLANLLGNAMKFTRTRERSRIQVGSRVLPQGTAIYVRDNGVGFDMKFADKLFGVFQRLHRMEEFEGTGVGLATVARIVHKHGGTVWAESMPEQGATFYFVLGESVLEPAHVQVPEKYIEVTYAAAR